MTRLAITPEMDMNPQVVLGRTIATLIVQVGNTPPWPTVQHSDQANTDSHWLSELFSSPMGGPRFTNKTARGFEFEVEPGIYTFCPDRSISSKCIHKMLAPGTETVVDLTSWSTESP